MGRNHKQPQSLECGDKEGPVVCGVLVFDRVQGKKKSFFSKDTNGKLLPVRSSYFGLEDIAAVVAELAIDTSYSYYMYNCHHDYKNWKWFVVRLVNRGKYPHYIWRAENLLPHMTCGTGPAVSIRPYGLLPPEVYEPGQGCIVGDYFMTHSGVWSLKERSLVRNMSGDQDFVAHDDFHYWMTKPKDSKVYLCHVVSGETLRSVECRGVLLHHTMSSLFVCGFPDLPILGNLPLDELWDGHGTVWMDGRTSLVALWDDWDSSKERGVWLVDRSTGTRTKKLHSLVKAGNNRYLTVSTAWGWLLMFD